MTILILGGTSEAAALDQHLAEQAPDIRAVISLAGHTVDPKPSNLPVRIGGFGGIEGLRRYLEEEGIVAVIDATHPFATKMPFHAQAACTAQNVPLLSLRRDPWTPVSGDRWQAASDLPAAVQALGEAPRRVFVTIGRSDLPLFTAAPQHSYLIRAVEPIGDRLPVRHIKVLAQRGPFHADDEEDLMRRERIELLVSRNVGGKANAGKLEAARRLGLPVIMVERPPRPEVETVAHVDQVLPWLVAQGLFVTERGV
jgi:precorrin-6A/cobalt-precorrin-6A reductase